MAASALPETTSKFTLEQRQLLGRVYATILRWNNEDEKQASQASLAKSLPANDNAGQAENSEKE